MVPAILTLRTGIAYEVSPVDGPTTRLVQDPDSNRVWLSLGGSYDWNTYTRLDFSYSHVFYENNAPFNSAATGDVAHWAQLTRHRRPQHGRLLGRL